MKTVQKVYIVNRCSSTSATNVIQGVYRTFDLAQEDLHIGMQNDIKCFKKSDYSYPYVSSSLNSDDEEVFYTLYFKHPSYNEVTIKYSITRFYVRNESFYS